MIELPLTPDEARQLEDLLLKIKNHQVACLDKEIELGGSFSSQEFYLKKINSLLHVLAMARYMR